MTEYNVLKCLHERRPMAVEILASHDGARAWLGVYPLDPQSHNVNAILCRFGMRGLVTTEPVYHVRVFEVDRKLYEADVWLSEDDLKNKQSALAIGDDDLRVKLAHHGVQLEQLQFHFQNDYPI